MNSSGVLTQRGTDWNGHEVLRPVNYALDARDFKDTPGYAWLIIAANPDLSAAEIQKVLMHAGPQHMRSASWIRRHRWLFAQPGTVQPRGPKRNVDGLDERAFKMIAENPRLSSRQLAGLLRKNGIPRCPEWVRRHRLESVATTIEP